MKPRLWQTASTLRASFLSVGRASLIWPARVAADFGVGLALNRPLAASTFFGGDEFVHFGPAVFS